jgi:tetratricopeptide (TPR) repeat protein
VLEREQRWEELEGLAFNWTRVDGDDPQAWYLHGLALSELQRWPESERALERSVELNPESQQAWLQLGLVHAEHGRIDRAREARGHLEQLGSDLTGELDRALGGR